MAGVAPHEDGGSFEHVVYPTDFSPASKSGLRMAELFVQRTKSKLTLLNVIKLPRVIPVLPGEQPIVIPNRAADHLREDLEAQMAELTSAIDTEVNSAVTVSASPDQGIAEFVSQAGVDLIVIPRHSQHGVASYVFGHTAEHLVKISPVPVLVFTPRMS
jgi:nucleotide-binding universal stress UspA family protein